MPGWRVDTDYNAATPCASCSTGSRAAAGSTSCDQCKPGTQDTDNNAATPCVPSPLHHSQALVCLPRYTLYSACNHCRCSYGYHRIVLGLTASDITVLTFHQTVRGIATFASVPTKAGDYSPTGGSGGKPGKAVKALIQSLQKAKQPTENIVVSTSAGSGRRQLQTSSVSVQYSVLADKDISHTVSDPGFASDVMAGMNMHEPSLA